MKNKQKLELTWIGKENRPRLELSLHGEALKAVIRKNGWSLPV